MNGSIAFFNILLGARYLGFISNLHCTKFICDIGSNYSDFQVSEIDYAGFLQFLESGKPVGLFYRFIVG